MCSLVILLCIRYPRGSHKRPHKVVPDKMLHFRRLALFATPDDGVPIRPAFYASYTPSPPILPDILSVDCHTRNSPIPEINLYTI